MGEGDDLRTYLQRSFFDYHKRLYENRPIYFPLSSAKKSYVAFVSIHRWQDDTLATCCSPTTWCPSGGGWKASWTTFARRAPQPTRKPSRAARPRSASPRCSKLLEELSDFIAKVTEVAEHGPPAPDDKTAQARMRRPLRHGSRRRRDGEQRRAVAAAWSRSGKTPRSGGRSSPPPRAARTTTGPTWPPATSPSACAKSACRIHRWPWPTSASGSSTPPKPTPGSCASRTRSAPTSPSTNPTPHQHRAQFLQAHPDEAEAARAKETQRRTRKAAKGADEESDTPLLDGVEEPRASDA